MLRTSTVAGSSGNSSSRSWGRSVRGFLARHPILFLLVLAPEVEYLTGSSQLSLLIGNPPVFLIFVLQNVGYYGAADLLIREAQVRWQKGWATVLTLGAAYRILNEGIGTGVLFNPATPAGLGGYGHVLGVNWTTLAVLVPIVHPLYSVSLPLLLFGLALPDYRTRSLLSTRGIGVVFVLLGADVVATSIFVTKYVSHYYAGPVLLTGCVLAIVVLVIVARFLPAQLVRAWNSARTSGPLAFAVVGAAFPWIILLGGDVLARKGANFGLAILFVLSVGAIVLAWVLSRMGRSSNESRKTALAIGLIVGLIPMGILSQLGTGVGLIAVFAGDLLAAAFCAYLWKRYRETATPSGAEGRRSDPSAGAGD